MYGLPPGGGPRCTYRIRAVTPSQREGGQDSCARCILVCYAKPTDLLRNDLIRIEIDMDQSVLSASLSACYFQSWGRLSHAKTARQFVHLLPWSIHYTSTNTSGCLDINYSLFHKSQRDSHSVFCLVCLYTLFNCNTFYLRLLVSLSMIFLRA